MAIILSSSERDDLRQRYQRAYVDQEIEVLGQSIVVERDGGAPESLSVDNEVTFERPDSNHPGRVKIESGTIVLFVRMCDVVEGRQLFAVIMAEGQHGQPRQLRVNIQRIRRHTTETSNQ